MSLPYVELSQQPQPFTVTAMPDGMAMVAMYESIEQLEPTEDGAERWRAVMYVERVPDLPGLAQRIGDNFTAWLARAKAAAEESTAQLVREHRDALLTACDYTAAVDYPATDAERDAWRDYRQALRDIPNQDGFPWDVAWPSKPAREKATDTIIATIDTMLGGTTE